MKYLNFYYEDFNKKELNLTDKIILSVISSVGDYSLNYNELSHFTSVSIQNVKVSLKKLKRDNLLQGEKVLTVSEKPIGKYFTLQIDSDLSIKENMLISYIKSTPKQAYFGSLQTLSDVLNLSIPTVMIGINSLIEKDRIRKDKYNKCYKYTIVETPSEEVEEEVVEINETNEEIPTADIELLNQRLTKASEVCKQLMNENKKQQETINQQQEQINQLKKSLTIYIDKFNKIDKVFQPILDCIDEQMRYIDTLYQETENKKNEFECKCDIKDIRNILARL